MAEVAKHTPKGVLQHELTKNVGIPANKLAYVFSQLEIDRNIARQPVYIRTANSAAAAANGEGTSSSMICDPGNARTTMRTNLVTVPGLAEPRLPAAPLSDYARGRGDEAFEGTGGSGAGVHNGTASRSRGEVDCD